MKNNLKKGDIFTLDNEVRLQMSTVKRVGNDEEWLFLFTNDEEASKEKCGDVIMNRALIEMLEVAYESDKVAGLVINPFGKYISLDKEMIVMILEKYREI